MPHLTEKQVSYTVPGGSLIKLSGTFRACGLIRSQQMHLVQMTTVCCFLGPKQAASQLVMKTEWHYALYQLYCMHLKIINAVMVGTFSNSN